MRNDTNRFVRGDEIFVLIGKDLDGILTAHYVDYVRTNPLLILLGVFMLATILMGRWKGSAA